MRFGHSEPTLREFHKMEKHMKKLEHWYETASPVKRRRIMKSAKSLQAKIDGFRTVLFPKKKNEEKDESVRNQLGESTTRAQETEV